MIVTRFAGNPDSSFGAVAQRIGIEAVIPFPGSSRR
jgi:hypothetical protein